MPVDVPVSWRRANSRTNYFSEYDGTDTPAHTRMHGEFCLHQCDMIVFCLYFPFHLCKWILYFNEAWWRVCVSVHVCLFVECMHTDMAKWIYMIDLFVYCIHVCMIWLCVSVFRACMCCKYTNLKLATHTHRCTCIQHTCNPSMQIHNNMKCMHATNSENETNQWCKSYPHACNKYSQIKPCKYKTHCTFNKQAAHYATISQTQNPIMQITHMKQKT